MKRTIATLLLLGTCSAFSQDSIDVTFRYTPPSGSGSPYVPGEFNGWNPTAWPMSYVGGPWIRTARLRAGGNPSPPPYGVPGAWQFKFYYNGASPWPNDPLDHHVNPRDNDNSFIYTRDPAIYQFLPNQRNPLINTATPTISAYIFPKVGTTVDTSSLMLTIDGSMYTGLGVHYNSGTKQVVYVPSPLPNGNHTAVLVAGTAAGGLNTDTVTFFTQAGFVQITTQGGFATLNPQRQLRGIVQDTSVHIVRLVRNNLDTTIVSASNGMYVATVSLVESVNTFKAFADSSGITVSSSPITFTYLVNHSPSAQISFVDNSSTIDLQATGSTDPDSGQAATLTFLWSEDPSNPSPIGGINGSTSPTIPIARPTVPGEYYFGLIATDVTGNRDTTRNYFTLGALPPISTPNLASVPSWVREGRLYEMFFKSFTAAGTINAAYPGLDRLAAMGFSILWVMPVMRNRDPIDNAGGPGYNIVDFYNVAPEYGTNQDFRNFVTRAHQLGMKVILDVTPNHTSSGHPFVLEARSFRENSRYWTYYQHQFITYTGPNFGNLPEAITPDQFVYYGPFSDAILNYNWADLDARQYMLDVYKWWIRDISVDGYRLDVYWGPHIRANSPNGGEGEMGRPMRQALKHMRPDLYILGEVSGVGPGTERFYADNSIPGGVESAYDWSLKNFIIDPTFWTQSASSRVTNLDRKLRNGSSNSGMGFLPGPNSYYMRFLENHDEDRVIYLFSSGVDTTTAMRRTMPVSTSVLLAVGMPMVYSGEEVGWGLGISNFDQRRRGVINWNTSRTPTLMPHYQKLAQIRKQFATFTTQKMVRVIAGSGGVYAYTRPDSGLNGIVVANLDSIPFSGTVTLTTHSTPPSVEGVVDGVQYTATDLYNGNTTTAVVFNAGVAGLSVNLPAFGSAVFVLADSPKTLILPPLVGVVDRQTQTLPAKVTLEQNYPNPFNPVTIIRYAIPRQSNVTLKVFDVLGREVATLVNQQQSPGAYSATWDASLAASGIYFYKLSTERSTLVKKMILLR